MLSMERPAKAGRDRHSVSTATTAARETCSRSELGGTCGQNSGEQVRFRPVQDSATVLLECSATSCNGIAHGAATVSGRKQYINDLAGSDGCEMGKPCEHTPRDFGYQ